MSRIIMIMLIGSLFALGPSEQQRYMQIVQKYRCVVCQGQAIGDSSSKIANTMKQQIQTMLANGQTDSEIDTYLVDRFGEQIRFSPKPSLLHSLLWVIPVILGLLMTIFIRRNFRVFISHFSDV
jgi:cytochrome c-type biogenesis protein CcmH